MSWSRSALAGATLALCATLSACGFQLRGKVDLPFETVYVEAPAYSKFGEQLKRGAEKAVADINAAGGVNGKQLKLEIGDDQ